MDFEEQLEKAEKLPEPSLVGSSLRSADDSAHNNYIHPEKYKTSSKPKKSSQKKSITASLDDLINEGALLGSEEDFERFLDDEGHVKDDAKYVQEATKKSSLSHETKSPYGDVSLQEFLEKYPGFLPEKESLEEFLKNKDGIMESPIKLDVNPSLDPVVPRLDPKASVSSATSTTPVTSTASGFYKQEDYSTPNLSEYQLENQIKDHKDLLTSIQSYDPHVLPKSDTNSPFKKSAGERKQTSFSTPSRNDHVESVDAALHGEETQTHLEGLISLRDSIHAPYFHTERSRSRSRSSNPAAQKERSRSRSAVKPHLARGDSYKNTNVDEPTKYELPPDLAAATYLKEEENEDEVDVRRTRQSRPTMGESIAKAEAEKKEAEASEETAESKTENLEDLNDQFRRDPSLVTTGDYTNFNVDSPANEFKASDNLYATRSISSTNYLRSISRSRSRARPNIDSSHENEKNDSNPQELVREGALVTDDPYTTIDHLDTMVEEVLNPTEANYDGRKNPSVQKHVEAPESEEKKDVVTGLKKSPLGIEDPEECGETETEKQVNSRLEDLSFKRDILAEDKSEGAGHVISASDISVDKEDLPLDEAGLKEPLVDVEDVKNQDLLDLAADKIIDEELEPKGPTITAEDIHVTEEDTKEKKESDEVAKSGEKDIEEEPTLIEKAKSILGDAEASLVKTLHLNTEDRPKVDEDHEDHGDDKAEVKEHDEEGHKTPIDTASAAVAATLGAITREKKLEEEKGKGTPIGEKDPAVGVSDSSTAVSSATVAASTVEDDEEFDVSPEELRKHLEAQPIYLFTSLAGGMQIMPRTNRLATILQANGIKFEYRDLGTDEEAKKLWKRQAGVKPIPGIVRGDDFIGNFQDIDDANEEYRLREILYETL